MCITSGLHPDCYVGQVGQQVQPTFSYFLYVAYHQGHCITSKLSLGKVNVTGRFAQREVPYSGKV